MSTEPAAAASSGDKRPASPLDADDERAAKQQRTDDRATTHDFFPEENLFVKPVRITQGAWAITVPRQRLWQTQCEYFRALIAPGVDLKPIELKADTFASFFDMRTVFEAILATGDVVVLPTGTTHDRLALLLKHIDYFELPRTSLLYETVWARAIQTATFEELVAMAERTHQDPDVCRQLVIRLMAPSSLCVMPADAKLRAALAPLLMEYTHARGEAWSMGTAPVKSHAPDTRAAKQLDRVKARHALGFAVVGGAGWHELNRGELLELLAFENASSEVQALSAFCYDSLLSGTIQIQTRRDLERKSDDGDGGDDDDDDGDTLEPTSPEDEVRMSQRSLVFGGWAREAAHVHDAIGFVPTVCVPNEDAGGDSPDPLRPSVLNLERVRIFHHLDVMGRHQWRFFEILEATPGGDAWFGEREIQNVFVLGDSLPDTQGRLRSKMKRLMQGAWTLYCLKRDLTMRADRERAHPTLITQSAQHGKGGAGADVVSGAADPSFQQLQRETTPEAMAVHERVYALNRGIACHESASAAAPEETGGAAALRSRLGSADDASSSSRKRKFEQFELDAGRAYVPAHMPEAPADLLPARQAFLEAVCLEYRVPMAMISSGDATGKSRLNSETASPETAQIFRHAQAARKRQLEAQIREVYQFMYGEEHVREFLQARVQQRAKARRRGDPEPIQPELPTPEEMRRYASVHVEIQSDPDFATMFELFKAGVVRYDGFCRLAANHFQTSITHFRRRQGLSDEAMQIQGCAPDNKDADGKKPAAKKKKTTTK